ncbi:MAG: CHASE2 domain-containing protein [Planctomycetaceae bacterium]|nr:CHASE2 domain-containing protein [Planctomycetaceae bacterium]
MKLIERLRLTSTTSWVVISLIAVLAWGTFDPFGIRQRLDWIVQDQFLKRRAPAEIHPDLLQVSLDDYAAAQFGKNDQRHRMARALRQLERLGAKTVLVDMLFLDRGSPDSFYQEEAARDGIPDDAVRYGPNLQNHYLEDRLLSDSLSELSQVVISFHLLAPAAPVRRDLQPKFEAMAELLQQDALLKVQDLAQRLSIDSRDATLMYEPACELAADRIARDSNLQKIVGLLEQDILQPPIELTATDVSEELGIDIKIVSRLFDPAFDVAVNRIATRAPNRIEKGLYRPASPVFNMVSDAVDRRRVLTRLRAHATPELIADLPIMMTDDPHVPLDDFAANAKLGFADFDADGDGTFRRMQLLARWGDRGLTHQSLTVLAMHLGTEPTDLRVMNGSIRIGTDQILPVDSGGRLVINWPMNGKLDPETGRRDWEDRIPQLSVADLIDLADYDANLQRMRYNLRINIIQLDNDDQIDLGFSEQEKCDALLNEIIENYITEDFSDAKKAEKLFDNQRIPLVLKHEGVQALLSRARNATPADVAANDQSLIAAMNILKLQKAIPQAEVERDQALRSLLKRVKGKLCLVGDTTTAGTDLKRTPVGPNIPGISINFAAINTMLTGRYLSAPGLLSAAILTIVLAGGFSWFFNRTPAKWSFAAMSVGLLIIFYGHFLALAQVDTLASPVLPMSGVFACFLVITTRRWWNDVREKQKVREVFQYYLHPAMVDKLISQPELVRLGGEDADLSILFADIRGFSGIAEKLTAEQLQKYLNGFFTPMSRIAQDHGGTIDKYIGDEMMVFYGAPLEMEDHATQATLTALKMIDRLADLQKEWSEQGLPEIHIGIGINTDVVRVGNFGSDDKFDYTVIGDGVNLASRLQGTTKQYGVQLIVGEKTWKRLGNRIAGREIDRIQVQGKLEPTRIFNPVGVPPLDETEQQFLNHFNAGIAAFQDRKWHDALTLFQKTLAIDNDDVPSQLYIERCERFMATPPPADWSGVTTMTVK